MLRQTAKPPNLIPHEIFQLYGIYGAINFAFVAVLVSVEKLVEWSSGQGQGGAERQQEEDPGPGDWNELCLMCRQDRKAPQATAW